MINQDMSIPSRYAHQDMSTKICPSRYVGMYDEMIVTFGSDHITSRTMNEPDDKQPKTTTNEKAS